MLQNSLGISAWNCKMNGIKYKVEYDNKRIEDKYMGKG